MTIFQALPAFREGLLIYAGQDAAGPSAALGPAPRLPDET